MLLSEFFTPGAWAIVPGSLDAFFQILINAATPGADQTPPSLQTASPSSASGDVRPAGYFLRDGVAVIDVRGVISRRGGRISFFGMTFEWQGQDTIRDGITMFGQNVNVGAAYNFSLRESAGGAVSSLGGVMRLSARDLLAQSYCKAGYQSNMTEFIRQYTATAKGMRSEEGDVPSYTALLPSLVQCFSGINWGYASSTSNYSDPAGDYAAYCGTLLQILSLTYTGLDLSMSAEMKRSGGRDAFNAAVLADMQEKVQEMLGYIDDAGDPARAVHNSFMHLTSSADAVLSGYDNERLSVNVIDGNAPLAGTSGSLIAKETARLQKGNSAESTM